MTNIVNYSQLSKPKLSYFNKTTKPAGIFPIINDLPKQHLFSNIPYLTAECYISCHSNLIRIKLGKASSPEREMPERTANDITKFSVNARRRMIQNLSCINLNYYSTPLFMTTTFHNVFPSTSDGLKKILRNFLKKTKRIDQALSWTWRLEWQLRRAPHFHFIFFFPNWYSNKKIASLSKELKSAWWSMLADHSFFTWKYSVKVIPLESKKKIFSYISKYNAKEEEYSTLEFSGQRHGSSKNLNTTPLSSSATSVEFASLFKKKIWELIKEKFTKIPEFEERFFALGTISILLDSEKIERAIEETLKELEFT